MPFPPYGPCFPTVRFGTRRPEDNAQVVDAEPFVALRYDPAVAGSAAATSAPAYDDVGRFDYARHRTASPYTVLELLSGSDQDGYRSAGATYRRWCRTGVLRKDPRPAYYVYEIHELRAGVPHVLRGVLAAAAVTDGNLEPHESVDPQRVQDRVRRLDAVPADLGAVFAVHTPAPPAMRAVLDTAPRTPPVIAFTDSAGADHRVWALTEGAATDAVREGLRTVRAVIADGHHRYAAARVRGSAAGEPVRTLAYLVDGAIHGPVLQAVHRLVRPWPPRALESLTKDFDAVAMPLDDVLERLAATTTTAFGLRTAGGASSLLTPRHLPSLRERMPSDRSAAWRALDAALWDSVVRPVLGPVEIGYRSDVTAAVGSLADSGDGALFLLRPPSLSDVFACAAAGDVMPAKTTWFRPKPRAGLIMRSLD